MQQNIRIRTPDHVELQFEPAGPVSRFAALCLDLLLILLAGFFILLASQVIMPLWLGSGSKAGMFWWGAIAVLLLFLLKWTYFALFEVLMRGQTPGKRLMGIRSIRDDGLPLGLRESAIRNLLRAADVLPPPTYLLGGLCALYQKRGKRLGDLAAGTIVVRESYGDVSEESSSLETGAEWAARLEAGRSRQAVTLPRGKIEASQVGLIREFMSRRRDLNPEKRSLLAWQIARPFLEMMGAEPSQVEARSDRRDYCERLLNDILERAAGQSGADSSQRKAGIPSKAAGEGSAGMRKRAQWKRFSKQVHSMLRRGPRALRALAPQSLDQLIVRYRRVTADLARAHSLGAEPEVVRELNRMAVAGHNLLYGHIKRRRPQSSGGGWFSAIARAVRSRMGAVALSAAFLFIPAVIGYFAVQLNPDLAYELVGDGFLDFQPATAESLHNFPSLTRPAVASQILTNNVQVALIAFGLGLTAGVGTALILVFNGAHIGGVAGWFAMKGNSRALWGWIMPHGGMELLAIVLAGAAGFVLAEAILSPGRLRRSEALKRVGGRALTIELGCILLLIAAAVVEGFVSPSQIPYWMRIGVLATTLSAAILYLAAAGRETSQQRDRHNQGSLTSHAAP